MKQFFNRLNKILLICLGIAAVVILAVLIKGGSDALGWLSNVLQVVTVAIAVSAWFTARALVKDDSKVVKEAQKNPESMILIVDIGEKDILGQVSSFAKKKGIISESESEPGTPINTGNSTFSVSRNDRMINLRSERMPEDEKAALQYRHEFEDTLETVTKELRKNGCSTIHLFVQGPVTIGYYIGICLKNNFKVIPYHHISDKNHKSSSSGDDTYIAL